MMDVVYYVRPGERNEELRYSLRSLVNMPHERVWLVGHKPAWVTGVEHIPNRSNGSSPQHNAASHLLAACDAVPAERFVVFNDDFYVMEPIEHIPALHGGPLSERRRPMGSDLRAAARKLYALGVRDPLDWTLHVPLVVVRNVLRGVLSGLSGHEWRTMYGNLSGLHGERTEDVKVRRRSDPIPAGPFLSSSDNSVRWLMPLLRERLSLPSPYEAAA